GLWGLFGLAQTLQNESGLMTAVTAGIMLRVASVPEERLLRRFKNQLSILAISVLFILLSADLSVASIFALGPGGFLTVITLMVVVRPINIIVSTWNSDLNWRQKAFLSWVAPRGIVAASVASLFSISLTQQGINGGDAIKALVFLTIILTVFVQGLTARWVADWLGVRSDQASGAMIVGCNAFGRQLAHLLKNRGEDVVMIDANPDHCQQARAENFQVFQTSALDMEALNSAGVSSFGTFLTVTSNLEVNSVLAERVNEEFHPPRVLAAFPSTIAPTTGADNMPTSPEIKRAFSPKLSIKKWNKYLADGEVKVNEMVLDEDNVKCQRQRDHLRALAKAGTLIPMIVERQEQVRVAKATEDWQPGDRIIYLLHIPKLRRPVQTSA
ncbi:MAG: NAD-binding protein, partial [Thermosynechococcaceae cyanobacterium]